MSKPAGTDDPLPPDREPRAGTVVRVLEICNKKGLHARASAKFVQTVERFDAEVRVTRGHETVGGTSIMGLMMLAAGPGTTITVEATGPEAARSGRSPSHTRCRAIHRRRVRLGGSEARASRRVGKIARHCEHDCAASRNFAHASHREVRSRGQRAATLCAYFNVTALARCPPYDIAQT